MWCVQIIIIIAVANTCWAGSRGYLETVGPAAMRVRQASRPLVAMVMPPLDMGVKVPVKAATPQTASSELGGAFATADPQSSAPADPDSDAISQTPEALPTGDEPSGRAGDSELDPGVVAEGAAVLVPPEMFLRYFRPGVSGTVKELLIPVSSAFVPPQPLNSRPSTATYHSPEP